MYNIDNSRVYVGGISGGALASVFTGMIYPDVFTGIIATEHVMSHSYWSRIYTLGEMFEMASHGQRWSHILGEDSYAWSSLAPLSTSWKYSVSIDSDRTPTRVNYDPFFDTYNQFVPGMAHSNPAPDIFEKSLLFVEAPSQRPRVSNYDDWEKYAFRLDDPASVKFSFNVGETPPVAGDPTINHLPDDDFDGDGIKNWLEYLLNTDPTIANDAPATPLLSISGTQAVLQYRAGALDQQTVIHTSTDLINWDTTGNGAQLIDSVLNPGEALGTTRFAPSTAGLPKLFYKAVITRQTP